MVKQAKSKIVSFSSAIKSKEIDGERRIVFVASSASVDRHYEQVNVASLRLPLKGGGEIIVGAIPEEGISEIIDIPLMLNHSGDVRDVIGSVRRAYFSNGELVFEAGISSREIAQDMLTLIDEGHLSNAFSITMIDYDFNFEAETISNAEVIEVSLVYRGSNKDARIIAIKSIVGDKKMPEAKSKQNDTFGTATGDGIDHNEQPAENVDNADSTPVETTENEAPEQPEASAETQNSEEGEDTPTGEETDGDTTNQTTEEGDNAMNKSIATDSVVKKAAQPVQAPRATDSYLKSKAALLAFRDIIKKNHRGSTEQIMSEWGAHLKSKGITGDAILPAEIESIFFKAWIDNPGILGTFRHVGARGGSLYAMGTDDTALGHQKGEKKKEQTLKSLRRDIKGKAIYKRLDIDLQDIFDDSTGELLKFRVEELADRVANAIVVGALLTAGTGKDATLEGTRGLYPVVADAGDASGYGSKVVTKVDAASKTEYEIGVEVVESVKDKNNQGKILIVPEGFRRKIRLMKDSNGNIMFAKVKLEELFEVKAVYELPELNSFNSGKVKAIAYVDQAYVTMGENNATVRTDFDLDYNQDVMLTERYIGGSAQGYKTFAVAVEA